MAVVATPTLPVVFGMAGGGLGAHKASRITKGLTEFQFVSLPMASLHADPSKKKKRHRMMTTTTVVVEGTSICTPEPMTKDHLNAAASGCHADDSGAQQPGKTEEVDEFEEEDDDEDDMMAYEIDWVKGEVKEKDRHSETEVVEEDIEVEPFPQDVVDRYLATQQPEQTGHSLALPKPTFAQLAALKRLESDLAKWDMEKTVQKVARQEEEAVDASSNHGIRVGICAQGWLWKKTEVTTLWKSVRDLDPSLEAYSLKWETDALHDLGVCLVKALSSKAATFAAKFWLASMSVLIAGLFSALMLPLMVVALCGAIGTAVREPPWPMRIQLTLLQTIRGLL